MVINLCSCVCVAGEAYNLYLWKTKRNFLLFVLSDTVILKVISKKHLRQQVRHALWEKFASLDWSLRFSSWSLKLILSGQAARMERRRRERQKRNKKKDYWSPRLLLDREGCPLQEAVTKLRDLEESLVHQAGGATLGVQQTLQVRGIGACDVMVSASRHPRSCHDNKRHAQLSPRRRQIAIYKISSYAGTRQVAPLPFCIILFLPLSSIDQNMSYKCV